MSGLLVRLFHYTTEEGVRGILETQLLQPSLVAVNPEDARYGDGQYLSDIVPGAKSLSSLSRTFLGFPFQGRRFTHFIEIDVANLSVFQGRESVFVILGSEPLDLTDRILSSGLVPRL